MFFIIAYFLIGCLWCFCFNFFKLQFHKTCNIFGSEKTTLVKLEHKFTMGLLTFEINGTGVKFPGTGFTHGCESPVGGGNYTWVPWKSSQCCPSEPWLQLHITDLYVSCPFLSTLYNKQFISIYSGSSQSMPPSLESFLRPSSSFSPLCC